MNDTYSCDGYRDAMRPTRRDVLKGAGAATLTVGALLGGFRTALAQIAVNPNERDAGRDVLVSIFLRGAADGLSMVVPYGDDDYFKIRPTLGLAAPKKGVTGDGKDGKSVDIDGFFGLHPSLAPLHQWFADGSGAAVHAIGSGDQTHSHFEAMATMERGLFADPGEQSSGWIARHLLSQPPANGVGSPLRAVAFSSILFDSLRGATDCTALNSLTDFRLHEEKMASTLSTLYSKGSDAVTLAGRETLAVLQTLKKIDPAHYQPANGAVYPTSGLGNGLKQAACLIKARVGLEVACLDRGGWDTHVAQGGAVGFLALQFDDVAKSVAAFLTDLGKDETKRVTVIVQTEFGRRAYENSGLGTDHGRASAMLLFGGSVQGGKVYGKWPGLKKEQLEDPGDLRVTTDYRDVLAEFVDKRLGNSVNLPAIFPGAKPKPVGIFRG